MRPRRPRLTLGGRSRQLLALLFITALPFALLRWMPGNWLLAATVTAAAALILAFLLPVGSSNLVKKWGEMEGNVRHGGQPSKKLLSLVNLSETLLGSMDIDLIAQKALEEAVTATQSDGGAAFLVNGDGKEFQAIHSVGLPAEVVGSKYPMDAHTATGYAMLQRKIVASVDLDQETRFQINAIIAKLGVKSTLSAPMLMDGRTLGAITLANFAPRLYSQDEIDLVQAITNHTAIALDRIKLINELSESYDRMLSSLVRTLDTRDRETQGHSQRVVVYSLALADAMGVEPDMRQDIERGARLHDIGKLGVPDPILHKTGKLSEQEWAIVRNHPEWGKQILEGIGFLTGAAEIVVAHHERWDGQGYPRGLEGEEIPLGARIFAVADAFDAMTSYRPYRDPRTFQKAREEIRKGSGNQFDPQVVSAFLKFDRDHWIKLRERSEGAGPDAEDKELGSLRRVGSGQLQAMNVIVAAITSTLELDALLQQCVQSITSVTRAAATGVYLFDAQSGELNLAARAELPEALAGRSGATDLNEVLNTEMIREGITQFHQDLQTSSQRTAQLLHELQPEWKSALIVPLQEAERTLGALALFSLAPSPFDEDERVLFDHVAKQLAQAIANARAHEKLRLQAITDALTGAYNRHYLDDFLNIEVKRCQRYKRPVALVMLDIDRFKGCNDISGHQGGDKALQDVVQLLNVGLRSVDMVARYGGEEFLVVLPETDATGAMEAAERMRRLIEKHRFPCGNLTASLGVAASSYQDSDAPGAEELIARADKALFTAKQAGRNKSQLWKGGT